MANLYARLFDLPQIADSRLSSLPAQRHDSVDLDVDTRSAQAVTSIIDGRTYVGKTLMPTEILVMVPVFSNGVNFLITIALLFPVSFCIWAFRSRGRCCFCRCLALIELIMTLGFSFIRRDRQRLLSRYAANRRVRAARGLLSHADLLRALRRTAGSAVSREVESGRGPGFCVSELSSTTASRRAFATSRFAGAFSVVLLLLALVYFNRHRDSLGEYVSLIFQLGSAGRSLYGNETTLKTIDRLGGDRRDELSRSSSPSPKSLRLIVAPELSAIFVACPHRK